MITVFLNIHLFRYIFFCVISFLLPRAEIFQEAATLQQKLISLHFIFVVLCFFFDFLVRKSLKKRQHRLASNKANFRLTTSNKIRPYGFPQSGPPYRGLSETQASSERTHAAWCGERKKADRPTDRASSEREESFELGGKNATNAKREVSYASSLTHSCSVVRSLLVQQRPLVVNVGWIQAAAGRTASFLTIERRRQRRIQKCGQLTRKSVFGYVVLLGERKRERAPNNGRFVLFQFQKSERFCLQQSSVVLQILTKKKQLFQKKHRLSVVV